LEASTLTAGANWSTSALTLDGSNWGAKSLTSYTYTISFDTGSADYIENVFSKDAQVQTSGQNTVAAYLYNKCKSWYS